MQHLLSLLSVHQACFCSCSHQQHFGGNELVLNSVTQYWAIVFPHLQGETGSGNLCCFDAKRKLVNPENTETWVSKDTIWFLDSFWPYCGTGYYSSYCTNSKDVTFKSLITSAWWCWKRSQGNRKAIARAWLLMWLIKYIDVEDKLQQQRHTVELLKRSWYQNLV